MLLRNRFIILDSIEAFAKQPRHFAIKDRDLSFLRIVRRSWEFAIDDPHFRRKNKGARFLLLFAGCVSKAPPDRDAVWLILLRVFILRLVKARNAIAMAD